MRASDASVGSQRATAFQDLNERQQLALRWLAENADCADAPARENHWEVPVRRIYAFQLYAHLEKNGHSYQGRGDYQSQSKAAANTLKALRRRGLAAHNSGGVFVQAEWWITPAGSKLVPAPKTEGTQDG